MKNGLSLRKLSDKYNLGTSPLYKELKRLFGKDSLKEIRGYKPYRPPLKIYIPTEKEDEFKEDLKNFSANFLMSKYEISNYSRFLREVRRILNDEDLRTMAEIKKAVGGQIFDINKIKKNIPDERIQDFKRDVRNGMSRRDLGDKYGFGTKSFYRNLENIFGTRSLVEARKK